MLFNTARANETNIAVAANFMATATEIATAFTADTGHKALLSFGSTGKLYAQIAHGAPFQAFLAADSRRPERAEAEGWTVAGSRFPYAFGKIVLYSRDPTLVDSEGLVLKQPWRFNRLAIANPETAPYGTAAVETMKNLGLFEAIRPKLVQGSNMAQAYQFVATGNAPLGFVALSQVIDKDNGSKWRVPESLHGPIRQDAVLLRSDTDTTAARAFLDYLKGDRARAIIANYGYGLP